MPGREVSGKVWRDSTPLSEVGLDRRKEISTLIWTATPLEIIVSKCTGTLAHLKIDHKCQMRPEVNLS